MTRSPAPFLRQGPPCVSAVAVILFWAWTGWAAEVELRFDRKTPLPAVERWHYRTAVPLPEGALRPGDRVDLLNDRRQPVACQFTTLATWGPAEAGKPAPAELLKKTGIRWLGLDFTGSPRSERGYVLAFGGQAREPQRAEAANPLRVSDADDAIAVDNGLVRFSVRKRGFNLIDALSAGGRQVIRPASGLGAYATREDGVVCWSAHDADARVTVEESGPMLAVIRAEGWHKAEGVKADEKGFCRFVTRIYAYADVPCLKVQHTWINTEDSEKTRYGAFGVFIPGGGEAVGLPAGGQESVSLLVKDWERFDLLRIRADGSVSERVPAGGDACGGWFTRGDIGFGIRDFVQNYPKEVEFAPAGTWVHFWPRRGEDAARPPTADNLWRMWFCHEGRLLSFRLPEGYRAAEFQDMVAMPQQGNGYRANAMGLAKTHEMLFVFGDAAADTRAWFAAFQADPKPMSDSAWNCASGVFGRLTPAQGSSFPEIEAYFQDGHESYVAWRDRVRAWGMWTYGDTHSKYGVEAPTYYRLMQATHYSPPTSAWLLYFRSGAHSYLTQARRNGLHVMDLDLCHYVAPGYRHTDPWFDAKAVGGLCDYKGYVHWHAGARACYNSVVDFLWWDWYVNGNRRALDVAHEHGGYVRAKGHAEAGRSGAAVLDALFFMYLATWDTSYWDRFRRECLAQLAYDPKTGPDDLWLWRAWWRAYLQFVDDPLVQKAVLEVADFLPDYVDIQADAYTITGAPAYLERIQNRLATFAWHRYSPPRSDTWYMMQNGAGGCEGMLGYELRWLFDTKRFPYAMHALQTAAARPALDIAALQNGGAWAGSRYEPGRLLMLVDNPDGRPMDVPLRRMGASWYSVVDPEGRIVAFRDERVAEPVHVPAPDARPGLYAVCFASPGEAACLPKPGPERIAFAPEKGVGFYPDGFLHVFVPRDTRRFVISYRAHWNSGYRSTFNLVDPGGVTRRHDDLPPGASGRVEINPSPDETGRTWLLAGRNCEILDIEGIPPVLAPAPERFPRLDGVEDYLWRLRSVALPEIQRRETEHKAKALAEDRAALNDPGMNGVMKFLHHETVGTTRPYGGLPPNLRTFQTAQRPGQYLEWLTLPVPEETARGPACVFTWIADMEPRPRPPQPNFTLSVNSEDVVSFSVTSQSRVWQGDRGVTLAFEARSTERGGAQGTFRLTVPSALLKAGESVWLKVHSPKGDNGVWFGIFEACIRQPQARPAAGP